MLINYSLSDMSDSGCKITKKNERYASIRIKFAGFNSRTFYI